MPSSYSTIDTTIRRALLGEGDEGKARYVQAFVHARRWYESEYTGDVEPAYGHKTIEAEVGPDRSVDLPDDYVEWAMVGLRRGEHVVNLLHNPRLVPLPFGQQPAGGAGAAVADGDYYRSAGEYPLEQAASAAGGVGGVGGEVGATVGGEYTYPYRGLAVDGRDVLGYGYPALRPGEFTVHRAERVLLVSSAISPGQVLLLSYLSNDTPCGSHSLIHALAEPWLEFYVLHYLHKKKNPALAQDYARDAEQARRDYLRKRSPFQLHDLYAAVRGTLAQTP